MTNDDPMRVRGPQDFLLGEWDGKSDTIPLRSNGLDLPEGFLELDYRLDGGERLWGEEEVLLASGIPAEGEGWELLLDGHSFLLFRSGGKAWARSKLPLCLWAGNSCSLGFALNNAPYFIRKMRQWRERVCCCNLWLLGRNALTNKMEVLAWETKFERPELAPVPKRLTVNPEPRPGVRLVGARFYNTSRHELYHGGARPECRVISDLPGMNIIHSALSEEGIVELYSGSPIIQSTSYWIYGRVEGAVAGVTKFRCHYSAHGGAGMGTTLFWSADRRDWRVLPQISGAMGLGYDFAPLFLAPADSFHIASGIPFLETERDELFKDMRGDPFVAVSEAGRSVQGRPIHVVRITDPAVPDREKRHVVFTSGQHSPLEMIGGHFLRPMWQHLRERPKLLRQMALYFVPIVNVDCAHYGTDGLNAAAINTNRQWLRDLTPETEAVRNYFIALFDRGGVPSVTVDLHASGNFGNLQMLGYKADRDTFPYPEGGAPDGLRERFPDMAEELIREQDRLLDCLERTAGVRRKDACYQGFRDGYVRDFFKMRFPRCQAFTLEISSTSYFDVATRSMRATDLRGLGVMGANLIRGIAEYLHLDPD